VSTKVLLAHDGDDLGMQVLDPLRKCVKVADCCDPFFTGTLPYVKMIKICVESSFAIICMRYTIEGCFLLFW
jgi:hypothetical protein